MQKKTLIVLLVVLAVVVGSIVAWKLTFPKVSFNYKMTVIVETPEGIKTGSAVRRIGIFQDIPIGDTGGGGAGVTGEAVVVDLGQRGVLFVLLSGDDDYYTFFKAFPSPKPPLSREGMKYYN